MTPAVLVGERVVAGSLMEVGNTLTVAVLLRVVTLADDILEKRCLYRELGLGRDCVASVALEGKTQRKRRKRFQVTNCI